MITYNELYDLVDRQNAKEMEQDEYGERYYAFREVLDHKGPLTKDDADYKGSSYNVLLHWENGEQTWEPLYTTIKDDPVTVGKYAKEHDLLDIPGWKPLKKYVRRNKKFERLLKQSVMKVSRNAPIYKFGVQIPRDSREAKKLDEQNGNTLWQDANRTELKKLGEYNTFKDLGHKNRGAKAPAGFKQIRCRAVYDCKHDLRRRMRMVAGGHLTEPDRDNSYSSVVSLRGLRLAIFIAELNDMAVWAADVSSAYLLAYTSEKVYFIAGPEFDELEGHVLVIVKALYGLRSSGRNYWIKFANSMRQMGFFQCKSEPDVWMRDKGDHYEYICCWVDDLAICSKDPDAIIKELSDPKGKHKYEFKGVGPISYHLGGNFSRDEDGTLAYSAETYIKKIMEAYERRYGEKPKEVNSPIDHNDHPELDMTELLDSDGISQYQSLMGQLQWAVSLCRFDIHVAVMTLSRFRAAPRKGHLERAKRVFGYLRKFPNAAIRFRTGIPDYSGLEPPTYDWMQTVYGCPKEEIGNNPRPLGNKVRTTTFEDANLMHDLVTGKSATGTIHLVNQTPSSWFSKRQATVETATYGSEFMSARQAVEQIQDLRITLRALGVPLDGPSWLFGDNQSVVTSGTIPHSNLNKRWNALSYHRVREACAMGMINFVHVVSVQNVADVLTKFLPYYKFKPLVEGLLFWKGGRAPTREIPVEIDEPGNPRQVHRLVSVMEHINKNK